MKSNHEARLLVTGASGQLGSKVVDELLQRGATGLIAVTRSPEKLEAFAGRGVEVRKGDFDDSASLDSAFAGAEIMLLVSTDALDRPGHRAEQHERAIDAAVKAGVKHIVYTSFSSPEDSPVAIAGDHRSTEAKLAASGIPCTVLRNNLYTESLLMSLPSAVASGKLYSSTEQGAAAYVTREDCALTAAGAVLSAGEESRTLDVTGPESLTQGDLAELTSELTGKSVEYVSLSEEQMVVGMVESGMPEAMAKVFVTFDLAIAAGKHDIVTGAVEELSGRKPASVRDFLAQNLGALTSA